MHGGRYVLGIPPGKFTPRVGRAVAALFGEALAMRREIERLRGHVHALELSADHDPLLPVLNRRAFLRELSRQIAMAARYGAPASLVYFDLDGFKRVNDTHGHACGDVVLAHFASFLLSNLRESDAVGRMGGDEFGVILAHAKFDVAEMKCARLFKLSAALPAAWSGIQLPVSFCYGACELCPGLQPESAIAQADTAMYRRKRLTR
ncbi:MAG TPA: GGDEF domain-containing protein [Rhizomicrobium sp.]|nr:GGDEF domain-containing protein [Rhizomicrobium sp.]